MKWASYLYSHALEPRWYSKRLLYLFCPHLFFSFLRFLSCRWCFINVLDEPGGLGASIACVHGLYFQLSV